MLCQQINLGSKQHLQFLLSILQLKVVNGRMGLYAYIHITSLTLFAPSRRTEEQHRIYGVCSSTLLLELSQAIQYFRRCLHDFHCFLLQIYAFPLK